MIRLTRHAAEAMEARGIALSWVEETVQTPDWTAAERGRPDQTRSYRSIAGFGGRVLRVVHRPDGADIVVITAHFDRDARP